MHLKEVSEEQERSANRIVEFVDLAKDVAERWKNMDDRARGPYELLAEVKKKKYQVALNHMKMSGSGRVASHFGGDAAALENNLCRLG